MNLNRVISAPCPWSHLEEQVTAPEWRSWDFCCLRAWELESRRSRQGQAHMSLPGSVLAAPRALSPEDVFPIKVSTVGAAGLEP